MPQAPYKIVIYDRFFNPITTLTTQNFYQLRYQQQNDKPGDANFKIKVRDIKATNTTLKLFNRVKIFKGEQFKFIGYIENLRMDLNEVEVSCSGMMNVFKKRVINYNTTPGANLTDEFFSLLNQTNAQDDTGITQGTSESTYVINGSVTFRTVSIYNALTKLAALDNKVPYIDENNQLNLVEKRGSDKSSTVIFQYDINQIALSTVYDYDVEVDGADMANRVTGLAKSISSTQSDAASIATFGLQYERKNFSETTNQIDLDNETETYLENHKNEIIIPRVKPNVKKIDPDSFDVGDIVKVFLDNGLIEVNQNHLITRKRTRVSDNAVDEVDINLTPVGSNILPSNFLDDISELNQRLSIIEGEFLL